MIGTITNMEWFGIIALVISVTCVVAGYYHSYRYGNYDLD